MPRHCSQYPLTLSSLLSVEIIFNRFQLLSISKHCKIYCCNTVGGSNNAKIMLSDIILLVLLYSGAKF